MEIYIFYNSILIGFYDVIMKFSIEIKSIDIYWNYFEESFIK